MEQELVSVIIPVYNVEDYLEFSLDCIVNQTYKNIEIIIINDGSTDSSLEIINKYKNKYSNIIFINQENQGQSVARNKGIDIAIGTYIYFFDSDDLLELDAIEECVNLTKKNKLDLLMFNGDTFTEKMANNRFKPNYIKVHEYLDISSGPEIFKDLINNKEYTCSPCLFFAKTSVIKNNLSFYNSIIHEDELFAFKLIFMCERVQVINDILFHRRIRSNSTMTGKNHYRSFIGFYTVLNEMIQFRDNLKNISFEVNKAIKIKASYIYGSAINQYILLNNTQKNQVQSLLKNIKNISRNENFFNRKEYRLFDISINSYSLLRKLYDRIKR